jgi:hypothetical protein
MKQYKWQRREQKQFKAKNGMRVDGASVKLLVEIQKRKAGK